MNLSFKEIMTLRNYRQGSQAADTAIRFIWKCIDAKWTMQEAIDVWRDSATCKNSGINIIPGFQAGDYYFLRQEPDGTYLMSLVESRIGEPR
jgi:hypothetical protein